MTCCGIPRLALASTLALLPLTAAAQQSPSSLEGRWPGRQLEQQGQPQPEQQPAQSQPAQSPPAHSQPAQQAPRERAPRTHDAAERARPQRAPSRVIACSGIFGKDSSHIKLATYVGSDNISWGQVDGPEGSKLDATILYPRDPRRRLEVLWNSEASRSDTQLIVINGQSTWIAPKGLKLGMTLAALEKANGRPFSLKSFGGETGGTVTSWEGGALSTLPGGCKVGMRLAPDPKAPPPGEAIAGGKDIASNLPALKAVAPKVAEIIIGY